MGLLADRRSGDLDEIMRKLRLAALALVCSTQLVACGFGYYWQATTGHLSIMRQRRPVPEVIADSETPEAVRSKLETASEAVEFAHQVLLLPDNGSYQLYADTGRRYVVWNVVAAPEFSLQPRAWCFPVAGCVSYRGYFSEDAARDFAAGLAGGGDDIHVGGVAAYSTLGRFADPLLNTMMVFSDHQLAGLVFHELAHQLVYTKDDSKFNEGFASFVEKEGIYRWLLSRADQAGLCSYGLSSQRRRQTLELVMRTRGQLDTLYEQDVTHEQKRSTKQELFDALNLAYDDLRRSWADPPYFDHWFGESLNNARLAALATYDDYVPVFAGLLRKEAGDLAAFYLRVEKLASLPGDQRGNEMQALFEGAAGFIDDQRFDDACSGVSVN
jgi:predicted aminopeptidase